MLDRTKAELEEEAEEIIDRVKEYVETRGQILRLEVLEKASVAAGAAFGGIFIFILFFFFFVFIGFALAFLIAELTGHTYVGFLVVAGAYLLAGILFSANRKKWIEGPVSDGIIKNYFKEHEQTQN